MARFIVIAGPIAASATSDAPLRWIPIADGGRVIVREASQSDARSAGFHEHDGERDGEALLAPPPSSVGPGWGQVRLDVRAEEDGLFVRIPPSEMPAASVVDVDQSIAFLEDGGAFLEGRVLRIRHGSPASYRVLCIEAERAKDAGALAHALALGARAFEGLADDALAAVLLGSLAKDRALAWRVADVALRDRRDARAVFQSELDEALRERVARAWGRAIHRALARLGFKTATPIPDGARDWFFVVRPAVERLRTIPSERRDAFAIGIGRALEALGEPPGQPRIVPLASEGGRERFRLTLARRGEPEYRLFDLAKNENGDAIVSGRRVHVATPTQRILATSCSCGGRLYESDKHCRGCGKKLEDLGAVRIHGTFLVGATADVAALCVCGGPIGAEDRFCGTCGKSLENP